VNTADDIWKMSYGNS